MSNARTILKSLFSISFAVLMSLAVGVAQAQPFAYVTNQNDNNVSVINTASDVNLGTIPVGTGPRGLAIDSMGKRVYVANLSSNDVTVIDASTLTAIATVPVGLSPRTIAIISVHLGRVGLCSSNI